MQREVNARPDWPCYIPRVALPPSWSGRRTVRLLLVLLVAVVALEAVEWGVRLVLRGREAGEARWIWAANWPNRPVRPFAFQAVRDFRLAQRMPRARLLIEGDEQYLVYLNGTWVGGGAYRADRRWDGYDVGDLLRLGDNRLLVELRSARGVGGLLLCLQAGAGERCVVPSDGAWRTFERHLQADESITGGLAALVWGPSDAGRWHPPHGVDQRPIYGRCVDTERAYPVRHVVDRGVEEVVDTAGEKVAIPVRRLRWRNPMLGMLVLQPQQPAAEHVALLTYVQRSGPAAPDDPNELLVTQPGQSEFRPPYARTFRSLRVLGLDDVEGALIHPLRKGCEGLLAPPSAPAAAGLFGFEPPSGAAVEDEVRSELERLAGVARREGL